MQWMHIREDSCKDARKKVKGNPKLDALVLNKTLVLFKTGLTRRL